MVAATKGFEYVAHKPNASTFAEQKWSWTGLQPGGAVGEQCPANILRPAASGMCFWVPIAMCCFSLRAANHVHAMFAGVQEAGQSWRSTRWQPVPSMQTPRLF